MSFMLYDIGLLVIFVILVSIFLYRRKKNLKKEGLLLLYRTSWGMKLIEKVGTKFKKTLNFLSYVAIGLGYLLMGCIIYLFGKIVWIYVINPEIVRAIKIPPIMPLIPYLPQVFKLDFLPSFYFIYWIIIIAIVAIVHEFAHGIFARNKDVRIKTTGFGFFPFFLPVFLAAFVELDEDQMQKKSIFSQMSVLAAGTFANVLTGIFFLLIMVLFFSLAFAPVGVAFDTYIYSPIDISEVVSINGVALEDVSFDGVLNSISEEGLNEILVGEETFLVTKSFLELQQNHDGLLLAYHDAPAIRSELRGAISEINGVKIDSREKVGDELLKYSPGEEIAITTILEEETKVYDVVLGEHPDDENSAFLGIGFSNQKRSGVMGAVISKISSFRKPNVLYEAKFGAGDFIYNLLWWLVIVCFSIALVNMLPVGIFDGGRFFFLTILAITKSERKAKKAFKFITWFFLFLLAVIMAFWLISWIK